MTDPHATLVRALRSAGLLDDPAWREAFTAIGWPAQPAGTTRQLQH